MPSCSYTSTNFSVETRFPKTLLLLKFIVYLFYTDLKKKKSKKSSLIFVYLYKAKAKTYKNYNNGANYIQKELVHLIINDGVYVIKKKKKNPDGHHGGMAAVFD